jgi:hypothetical protein
MVYWFMSFAIMAITDVLCTRFSHSWHVVVSCDKVEDFISSLTSCLKFNIILIVDLEAHCDVIGMNLLSQKYRWVFCFDYFTRVKFECCFCLIFSSWSTLLWNLSALYPFDNNSYSEMSNTTASFEKDTMNKPSLISIFSIQYYLHLSRKSFIPSQLVIS